MMEIAAFLKVLKLSAELFSDYKRPEDFRTHPNDPKQHGAEQQLTNTVIVAPVKLIAGT